MFAHDCLALGLFHLKTSEAWLNQGRSLAFLFPKEGLGTFFSAGINHPLAPGDVLVFSEAQGNKVCPADSGELVCWHFSICVEHLYPLFGSEELWLLQNLTECFKTPRLSASSGALAQECHRLLAAAPPGRHLDHRGQLLRVVTAVLAVEFKDARRPRGGLGGAGEDMIQVFEGLMVEDIIGLTVGELADKFHCTKRHLNRLFQKHFGFNVSALRMEMRLVKAMTLLRNRDVKVIEVAEECGFNHLGLFNSCFKRRFGASPGHWRDANRPAQAQPAGLIDGEPHCRMQTNGLCPWVGKAPSTVLTNPKPTRLSPSPRGRQAVRSGDSQQPRADGRVLHLKIRV